MKYPFERLFLVCTGDRCNDPKRGDEGGLSIRETLKSHNKAMGRKRTVRVCSVSCLDLCELGPNMVVEPGHEVYNGLDRKKAMKIYEEVMKEAGSEEAKKR